MIEDVKIIPLKVFSDDRGKVMHMMKNTDPYFTKFGEIYFSEILPGKIKAWSRKKKSIRNYTVVEGIIKLVLYDGKEIREIIMGKDNHCLVIIPPGIWSGFKAIGKKKAIIADLTDSPYNSEESEKADPYALTDYWKEDK
jgi:dTDP-4-dehydrorhamnose 3,5-epimerase